MNSRAILALACMLLAAVCVQAADRVFDVTGVFKARLDDGRVIVVLAAPGLPAVN